VPSLLLQPLVEAAVSSAGPAPDSVEISAGHEDGRLKLRIHAGGGAAGGDGAVAIGRARRRLDLEYPGSHILEWSSIAREAVVEIPFASLAEQKA
jgi:LytS/YehU family sensor histidine kinase